MDPVNKVEDEAEHVEEQELDQVNSDPLENAESLRIEREDEKSDLSPNSKQLIDDAEDPLDSTLRKRFIESKIAKKQAEAEKQTLLNRIQLLKVESFKATKKIEDTKKKAKEIMEKKARLADIQKQKDELKRIKMEEIERLAKENTERRKALKLAIEAKQKEILTKKQHQMNLLKIETNHSVQLQKSEKEEDLSEKTKKTKAVKAQEIALKTRKDEDWKFKQEKAKKMVEDQISKEAAEKLQLDIEINRMQDEEAELLQKCQAAYLQQQSACEDLDLALTSPGASKASTKGSPTRSPVKSPTKRAAK